MTTIAYRQQAMTIRKLAVIATATIGATIGLAGIAHADDEIDFRSPSGDILCSMTRGHDINDQARYGKGAVACQVLNHTYPQPPLEDCPVAGREYDLDQGSRPSLGCQGGVIVDPPPPTLDYGQTRSVGTITCDVEPSGVTCTDSSTGHFLRLSRDSYQLG
ncbi:DUF6636 domain-containing protein [Mycobacterium szulgai]|nr:DUF6636 domain-containing protein [Mycobacterium szulgai]MCV7075985.1 hypothetical protein [Mycobacterium szulgai]